MKTITFPNSPYLLHLPFKPSGDQPTAITQLVDGIEVHASIDRIHWRVLEV